MSKPAPLEIDRVTKRFGALTAVDQVSLTLSAPEVVAVVGPNGAGKTTLLDLLSGLLPTDEGKIRVYGEDVTRLSAHRIAWKGVARGFQSPRLIDEIDITDNVLLGRPRGFRDGLLAALSGTWRLDRETHEAAARKALERVGMSDFSTKPASNLSFGQRKLVMLASLLAMEPKILLLDEPASGLSPERLDAMADILRTIKEEQNLVIFIEHNHNFVRRIAERVLLMERGRIEADGSPDEVFENDDDPLRDHLA